MKLSKKTIVVCAITLAVLTPPIALHYVLEKKFAHLKKAEPQSPLAPQKTKITGEHIREDGVPMVLYASGQETFLGKTFQELKETHGMCLLDEKKEKPLRSSEVWSEFLPPTATAQAEWITEEGFRVTVVWIAPGASSPSCIVRYKSIVALTVPDIRTIFKNEAPSAWQRGMPRGIERKCEELPKLKEALETHSIPEFTCWRMDGSSAQVTPTQVTMRNPHITRMELDQIAQSGMLDPKNPTVGEMPATEVSPPGTSH